MVGDFVGDTRAVTQSENILVTKTKEERIQELREKLFDIVTDLPCRKCEFWDVQGHYCFLKDMHPDTKKCALMDNIEKVQREACYLKAERELPPIPQEINTPKVLNLWLYKQAQRDMLQPDSEGRVFAPVYKW